MTEFLSFTNILYPVFFKAFLWEHLMKKNDEKRLQPRIREHRTSKMGTPKAWSRKIFCLKNGYLEFNLEKCNINESH